MAKILNRIVVTVVYLFLLAPIIAVVLISFNDSKSLAIELGAPSFQWYESILANSELMAGAQVSLVTAVVTAIVVLALGVPVSLAIARYEFPGKAAISGFFLSPLLVPGVVLGLGLLLVFQPVGLVGTYPGIVIAHFGVTVPYVIRTTLSSLLTSDMRCEEAARVHGANAVTTFRRVTLPIIAPGILAGGVMAFIISFDEAVISLFVAGSGHTTLPVEMFRYLQYRSDPGLAALSVILIALSVVIVLVIERAVGLRKVVGS
ncbi:ABC transporter permease [Leucobacter luti]|uniref:Putative spermidine/putrescine transport system permease protein n=1 Tax=Leucobacter luti TaxID=340320 RepID=A0A4V3CXL3_9MICO|nr:ABC transporter permease [Leucobacter luti]MCW2289559.1 putative spermidine/putrescine transport system permease protein [Leucobacter luti]QYM74694.1 ABC transporter permease [Leucobacter luti]TCK37731.1 putative spermidine/putrescine transport system permease protein [Leucobacter luti]TDP90718.1 putative spermidine/putrescine transport system permease protein [Leucobacter luti]